MKLKELTLINFRRFNELNIDFHLELTVIAAQNGQGKTSVLDAATIVLGTFIGAFDLGKAKHLDHNDARYHRREGLSESEQIFPVRLEAKLSNLKRRVVRELTGAKSKTTIKGAAELTDYGKSLMDQVRNLDPVALPVMAYYGSGRLWYTHKNMSRKAVLSESRTMGYEDCFTSASSFTQVQQWMSKATFAALQQQSIEAYSGYNIDDQIKGIQETVKVFNGGSMGSDSVQWGQTRLIMPSDPIEAIKFRMEQKGLTNKDLSPFWQQWTSVRGFEPQAEVDNQDDKEAA